MSSAALVAVLFCFSLTSVQAQDVGAIGTSKVKYCDAVLPAIEKQLQADADATGTTQITCVKCREKATQIVISATVVAQPKDAGATDIKEVTDNLSRGGAVVEPRFTAQIIQSPCFRGGTNLEVGSPGNDLSTREWSIVWDVDGQALGSGLNLACASGKVAKVRVTYRPTGDFVTLEMKLNAEGTDSIRN
ncbi:MAG: hypothetical protein K9J46_00110 [Saprospiraceae bacterium]|nr:hypothetical protein [Saprospiraceae bacterium]MCF8280872.1 hypothetical protein [Bacteroidales bacterium]